MYSCSFSGSSSEPLYNVTATVARLTLPKCVCRHNVGRSTADTVVCCRAVETAIPEVERCPLRGRYSIYTGAASCVSYFRSACNTSTSVDIVSTCSSKPGNRSTSPQFPLITQIHSDIMSTSLAADLTELVSTEKRLT